MQPSEQERHNIAPLGHIVQGPEEKFDTFTIEEQNHILACKQKALVFPRRAKRCVGVNSLAIRLELFKRNLSVELCA